MTPIMKPILFNTYMVRANLRGDKTETRRVVKPWPNPLCPYRHQEDDGMMDWWPSYDSGVKPPYQPGDILYVRETWAKVDNKNSKNYGGYEYRADYMSALCTGLIKWHPSIHMPREAARLFLRVTDVRMERLQEISREDTVAEGAPCRLRLHGGYCGNGGLCDCGDWWKEFAKLWDSTVKPADLDLYGWDANPWVWVIEYEQISREEAENG